MITIYGHHQCSFCDKAKSLLREKGLGFTYHNVRKDAKAMSYVKDVLQKKSVPQIEIDDKYIGGYEDLIKYLSASEHPDEENIF